MNKKGYIRLSAYLHIANNRNGLNQSLYNFFSDYNYTKKEIRDMLYNHPKEYPCVYVIDDKSFECRVVYLDILAPSILNRALALDSTYKQL